MRAHRRDATRLEPSHVRVLVRVKRRRSSIQNGAHRVSSFTPHNIVTGSKEAEEVGDYYRGAVQAWWNA